MKILLGGIPLGCDNIGDEAIIACVVRMLKASIPGVELAVATADPSTSPLLGVNVEPAFGFAGVTMHGFAETVRRYDAYIWCGATGLSDYPHVALDLLESAQKSGVATYIWGVGMDDELNPVFFKAHGRRRKVLSLFGLVGWYERTLRARLARRLARLLPRCRGVWLRDPESAEMLSSMGFGGAKVAADTAILLPKPTDVKAPKVPTLGLCISTQRQVSDLDGVKRLVASVRESGANVVGIPMNPKTDRALMRILAAGLEHPERIECLENDSPDVVQACAGQCRLVVSSRLHLLILAANAGVPGLGIERGSKISNWLNAFGRTSSGTVEDCDPALLERQILELAARPREQLQAETLAVMKQMHERLDKAAVLLREALAGKSPS